MFGVIYGAPSADAGVLLEVARACSPRVEHMSAREIVLDLAGLTRLFGEAQELAGEIRRLAAGRGAQVRVAVAGTQTAARLLAQHRAGVIAVAPGQERSAVAPLPVEALVGVCAGADDGEGLQEIVRTLRRWGLRTLGAFAALPAGDVAARLGPAGVRLQRAARGEDARPLVPQVPDERFEQHIDLEWPIEGLEPLSFVLGRLLDPLAAHLERRGRGAAILRLRLGLVTREIHARALQLPYPLYDARALRTLLLLDLESHPPPAAIDCVTVTVEPTAARVVQHSLLARPLPTPVQISTLMARLQALMGETRCGSPALVESWAPGAFAMSPFAPVSPDQAADAPRTPVLALRRFRTPAAVRVRLEAGVPVRLTTDVVGLPGGRVTAAAGPWRTSGQWWMDDERGHVPPAESAGATELRRRKQRSREGGQVPPTESAGATELQRRKRSREGGWDRDEWDVTVADGATCRIFRARDTDTWFIEGVVD